MHSPIIIHNTPNCQPFPWHPSVVFFKHGWNGHKWWMAQTPFPPFHKDPYRDRYELPCIHFSDNGILWEPIPNNPIDDLIEQEIEEHNYYSDPHLVFVNDKLDLYYRFTFLKDKQLVDNKTLLLRRSSSDGIHWSEKMIIADLRNNNDISIWGEQIISPSIVYKNNRLRCYYVDKSSYLTGRHIVFTESQNGTDWIKFRQIRICDYSIDPWHIDVQYYNEKYQLLVYDMEKLVWFDSSDGETFSFVSIVLYPSNPQMSFYRDGLYRSCTVQTDDSIRVFFPGKIKKNTYIGQLKTIDRLTFSPVNGVPMIEWQVYLWKIQIKSLLKNILKQCPINLFSRS